MPFALQTSLHLSFGETPAYLGVHSTAGPLPKVDLENSLCFSHCSSLKVLPAGRGKTDGHQINFCTWSSSRRSPSFTSKMGKRLPLLSGQSSMLHDLYCTRFPSQYFPPFLGTGLSHSLKEYCTPPPQLREQLLHGAHGPQEPSTGICGENHAVNPTPGPIRGDLWGKPPHEPNTRTHPLGSMGKTTP